MVLLQVAGTLHRSSWGLHGKTFSVDKDSEREANMSAPQTAIKKQPSCCIVLADEELRRLATRFGPDVWQMGSWDSDGVFGYASIPLVSVEKASKSLDNPRLQEAVTHLKQEPERAPILLEMLHSFGSALIVEIKAAYREALVESV
jgi:hypothetical protein